jgi:hypothetical protein
MSRLTDPTQVTGQLSKVGTIVREPIVGVNLLSALVLETIILLRQFGVPLSDGQVDAINAVALLLLLIAATLLGRRLTTPLADPRDKAGLPLTPDFPTTGAHQTPLDAPALPPFEEDVAEELAKRPTATPKGDGDDPIEGLRSSR